MFTISRQRRVELQKEIEKHNKRIKKYHLDKGKIDYVNFMMNISNKEEFKNRLYSLKHEEKLIKKLEKYNTKIEKEILKGTNINILPKTIGINELFDKNTTKRNTQVLENIFKTVNKRNAFKLVNNKNNIPSTQAQQQQVLLMVDELNFHIREKQKDYEQAKIGGREMTEEEKLFFKSDLNANKIREKNYNFDNIRSQKELQYFIESLKNYDKNHHWKDDEYKENYIKSLEDTLPPYLRKRFTDYMKTVPASEIARAYYVNKSLNIQLNYEQMGGSGTELKEFVKRTIHDWNEVQGKKDNQKLFSDIDNWNYNDEEIEEFYRDSFERQKIKGEIKKRRR